MNAEIELLSVVKINWDSFRSTMDKYCQRPHLHKNIELSEDAEYLLNIATFNNISYRDPLTLLRRYPHHLLEFLHYSFMVACPEPVYEDFNLKTRLGIITQKTPEKVCLSLVTGSLSNWYTTIIYNLQEQSPITELIDRFYLAFEKRGLVYLFEKYNKRITKEGLFLLEKR